MLDIMAAIFVALYVVALHVFIVLLILDNAKLRTSDSARKILACVGGEHHAKATTTENEP